MSRIDIRVPYSEKDQAKELGARWDPEGRTWYIPEGVEASQFAKWLPAQESIDAGQRESNVAELSSRESGCVDRKRVYIISGTNKYACAPLVKFLESAKLNPKSWSGDLKIIDSPQPISSQLLDVAFSGANAIIVLLTTDDQAQTNPNLLVQKTRRKYGSRWALQPYLETLFLAGLALGFAPDRTLLLRVGRLRNSGRVWCREAIDLDNSLRARQLVIDRLREIGCDVDTHDGKWRDAGDFESFMDDPPSEIASL